MPGERLMAAEVPPVDAHRLELAQKHVSALNNQFARWVQSQLHNHPYELWEDGVGDYLCHASNIMEKFSDVVAWLKASTTKEEQTQSAEGNASGFPYLQKYILDRNESVLSNSQLQIRSGIIQDGASVPSTWSSGTEFSSQNPPVKGHRSSIQTEVETAVDLDEEGEADQPNSPSVKKSEEKGIVVAHEVKCKVYVKPDNPADRGWKDMGVGLLSVKCKEGAARASRESKPTIVVRNDVGKILLNALIYPGIKMNIQKNTIASIFHTSGTGVTADANNSGPVVARMYLLKMKTEEETKKLASIIEDYAPTV